MLYEFDKDEFYNWHLGPISVDIIAENVRKSYAEQNGIFGELMHQKSMVVFRHINENQENQEENK